jgi:hypothetical protein
VVRISEDHFKFDKPTNNTNKQTNKQEATTTTITIPSNNMGGFEFGPFIWDLPIMAAMTVCAKHDPYHTRLSENSFRTIEMLGDDDSEEDADLQVLRCGGSLMDDDTDDDVEEEGRQDHLDDLRCEDGREQEDEVRDTGERRSWTRPPIDMENLQLPTFDF